MLYTCNVLGSGCALDVHLNEYHIYSSDSANHSYSANVRAWLERENIFHVRASAPLRVKQDSPVLFSVTATESGPIRSRLLAQMQFPEGVSGEDTSALPFATLGKSLTEGNNLAFLCTEPGAILEKPWKESDRLITNPADVYGLFEAIQSGFLEGNVARLMTLSRQRIDFCAKLQDVPRDAFEQQVREDLTATLAEKPVWKAVQHPGRELTVHEILPGKVMRFLDLRGHPPLRTMPDGDGIQFGYDIIVAMTKEGIAWIM